MADRSWYPRMGDIPGLDYNPPSGVDPTTIPGWDAVPMKETISEFRGREIVGLMWGDRRSATSASPANQFASSNFDTERSPQYAVAELWKGLELPGTPPDYHRLIGGVAGWLNAIRWKQPNVSAQLEQLCWLDVKLIQAAPGAIINEYADEGVLDYYSVGSFYYLIEIYLDEGYVQDARAVGELAATFKQDLTNLQERLAALEAEDAAV
jgi:hypothetical protein